MRVAIRVDASVEIGLGHLARCLALAGALRSRGASVVFVTRDLGLDDPERIAAAGFELLRLPAACSERAAGAGGPAHARWAGVDWQHDVQDTSGVLADWSPQWVIIDHYAFDSRWQRGLAAHLGSKLCVIDDLADRPLAGDLVVDHNLADDHHRKYAGCGIGAARVLGGTRFALLGAAYANAARHEPRERVDSIGILMGGTDPRGLSETVLSACRLADFDGAIEVATTAANPARAKLTAACARDGRARLLVDSPDLATFYARHGLQIGGGGGALLERCCIGAPTLALAFADNQRAAVSALAAAGAVATIAELDAHSIGAAVRRLLDDPGQRRQLGQRARTLVDGRGADRVALAMVADTLTLSPAAAADAEIALQWRNDERTRRHFRDSRPVPPEEHRRWWAQTLATRERELLVARCGRGAVGFVRLDRMGGDAEISYYLDPELTGLGLGSAALRAAQRWIEARADVSRIVAHVLPGNLASANAFAAAGFARVGASDWEWTRNT